jgi:hypothetical protein
MADVVEYIMNLKDNLSPTIEGATSHVKKMESAFGELGEKATHIVEAMGISFAVFKGFETIKEGIEKVEEFHKAEAALSNTMKNMGTYSEESFEKIVKGAADLSQKVGFSKAQFIGLQSQLQLVGNIGEKEMDRLQKVSADYATKFGMDLESAGNTLAKAINNPELARRLGMQLKIDPAVMEHVQKLAKSGKEAEARMELLSLAEAKVGGAAEAAFNADPLAKFNKMMGSVKMALGEGAIELLKVLQPALETVGTYVKMFANGLRELYKWIGDNKQLLQTIAVALLAGATAFGVIAVAMNAATIAATIQATVMSGLTTVIEGCAAAMEFLNATFIASPIGWIVLGVAALAAGVMALIHHFGSFNNAMKDTWEIIKAFGNGVVNVFSGIGESIKGAFTMNPKLIAQGLVDTVAAAKDASKQISDIWNNKDAQDAAAKGKSLVPKDEKGKEGKQGQFAGEKAPALKTKAEGQKVVNIHIAINGGLVHEMKIMTTNISQGYGKIKEAVQDVLVGVINDSQVVASF